MNFLNLPLYTMIQLQHSVKRVLPLLIIPYTVASLIVISYYAYLKYKNWIDIRNVPPYTRYQMDLDKVKKNLRIKSTVYNFILLLAITELIDNALMQTAIIFEFDIKHPSKYLVSISNSCVFWAGDLTILENKSTFLRVRALEIGIVMMTMFPIIMSLFYVILRRLFINYPYHQHIRKYIVYILVQFILKVSLSCFLQTWYFEQLILFPLIVIDGGIYMSTSHKFYLLLKGKRNEARIHSTETDYLNKKSIVRQFFFAQVATLFLISLMVTGLFVAFISVPLDLFANNPCYLSYISLGYLPDITIPKDINNLFSSITSYCLNIEYTVAFIADMSIIFINIALSIGIIVMLIKRRRRFININDKIKPFMERYRNRL